MVTTMNNAKTAEATQMSFGVGGLGLAQAKLSMGWVDPWVGLDWVGLGRDFSVFGGLGWVHYSKILKI